MQSCGDVAVVPWRHATVCHAGPVDAHGGSSDETDIRIERDDLSRAAVRALVAEHLGEMVATTPPESIHALDVDALSGPGISVWSAWSGPDLLGIGALHELDPRHGELKSMRTTAQARRRGVAGKLVAHLLREARSRGYRRVSLETGSEDYFEPARALYASWGFEPCPPFADYVEDLLSVYLTLRL